MKYSLYFLSLLPIPYVQSTAKKTLAHLKKKQHFDQYTASIVPQVPHPETMTATSTFNHTHSFIVTRDKLQDHIWAAPLEDQNPIWHMVYYPEMTGKRILDIHADGANLGVRDTEGIIHYKKIIGENVENDEYFYRTETQTPTQISTWFTLPLISTVMNLFYPKKLIVPEQQEWRFSHRGDYKRYYTDPNGTDHGFHEATKITQLYTYKKEKRHFRVYDPFMPIQCKIQFTLPELAHQGFDLLAWDTSGSAVFIIGYQQTYMANGQAKHELVGYFNILDLDSCGLNPAFAYTFDPEDKERRIPIISWMANEKKYFNLPGWLKHKRLLPMPDWQPIPLPNADNISTQLSIQQTGQGNHEFLLTIWGQNQSTIGKFEKKMNEDYWQFSPVTPKHTLSWQETSIVNEADLKSSVTNWTGTDSNQRIKLNLLHYRPGKLMSEGILTIGDMNYSIRYYERKSIIYDTLGMHSHYGDIIAYDQHNRYMQTIPVHIRHGSKQVIFQFTHERDEITLSLSPATMMNESKLYPVLKI